VDIDILQVLIKLAYIYNDIYILCNMRDGYENMQHDAISYTYT
jgi:hypothetical protein